MPASATAPARSVPAPKPQPVRTPDQVVADHRSNDAGELFGITELCREFDISPRAIRFYEDKGLLAPRRVNGTRVYTRRDRARLSLILRAKAIGSSLAEIKHYLDLYGAHGEGRTVQMKYVLDKTSKAIAELEQKRAHIDASLAELRIINATVKRSLGK
jgi:DNA-binding transcriptional MerR regulator